MSHEWLAVARGLKCLLISTKAAMVAIVLAIVGGVLELVAPITSTGGCFKILMIPVGLLAIVAFGFSIAGRLSLLQVPVVVRNARFRSLAALTFESISQASLGAYVVCHFWIVEVPRLYGIAWMSVTAVVGIAGMVEFFRFVRGLVAYFDRVESGQEWRVVWNIWIWTLVLIALAVAFSRLREVPALLVSLTLILLALVFLGASILNYLIVLKGLRFSALREALRCELEVD